MIKYIKTINTGKGFITHQDQEVSGLRFKNLKGLVEISGDETAVNNWIKRESGTELLESDYKKQKAQLDKAGIDTLLVIADREKATLLTKQIAVNSILNKVIID